MKFQSIRSWGTAPATLIIGETDGLVKIISQKDGPIIGVHIAGPWATELIAGVPVCELGGNTC